MKITNDQAKKLVIDMKERGFDVGLRDISYVILSRFFDDPSSAYRVTHGDAAEYPYMVYADSEKVVSLEKELEKYTGGEISDIQGEDTLSFDELKQGLIEDMNALVALRDSNMPDGSPVLEPKEMASVVGRIADIRVKLTEKFGTTEKSAEQRVVVMNKFDAICPYCHHEVSVQR